MSAMADSRRFGICLLGLTGIVLLGEGGMLVRAQRAADRADIRWKAKLRERSECETLIPAPTRENAARLEANLVAARTTLTQEIARLRVEDGDPDSGDSNGASVTSTDAFFELAAFVNRMRRRAGEEGVALNAGERFGFSTYAEEPPTAEVAARVLRQERLAETMLQILFAARPERLVFFQREPLAAVSADRAGMTDARSAAPAPSRGTQDYFTFDPQRSLRRAGVVGSTAFRMVFTGATGTLRSLLNGLAAAPLPLVVRSVEIERMSDGPGARALPRVGQAASIALEGSSLSEDFTEPSAVSVVVPAASKYTVIIEVVNWEGKLSDNSSSGGSPAFG